MVNIVVGVMPELQERLKKAKVEADSPDGKMIGLQVVYELFLKDYFNTRMSEILDTNPVDLPHGYDLF